MTFADEMQSFWTEAKEELAAAPLDVELELVEGDEDPMVKTYAVRMTSLGGVKIRAFYSVPDIPAWEPFPAVMHLPGYGGEMIHQPHLAHLEGFAWLTLYPRGQGESCREWTLPEGVSKLTMGLDSPEHQYYRGAYMDCLRGVDFLCSRREVDKSRIGVAGGSQGGGLALAIAALDERLAAAFAHIPFLCNYPVAIRTATAGPYQELIDHFAAHPEEKEQALATLAHMDPLNLCTNTGCPTMVTIGTMDTTCPPATIHPVYEGIPSAKALMIWPDLAHAWTYEARQLMASWLRRHLSH